MNFAVPQLPAALMLADSDAAGAVVFFIVLPLVQAVICWKTAEALKSIPAQHRFQDPAMVWLLMVPLFSLYWNFRVFPAVAESFQHYFYSRGISDVEDCGERLARAYCLVSLVSILVCVSFLSYPASLVLIILFLVKADELRNRIANDGAVPAVAR